MKKCHQGVNIFMFEGPDEIPDECKFCIIDTIEENEITYPREWYGNTEQYHETNQYCRRIVQVRGLLNYATLFDITVCNSVINIL